MRGLPREAAATRTAFLRPLWRSDPMAGRALPGVLGPSSSVRVRPRRGRIRGRCPPAGACLERAWTPPAGRRGRGRPGRAAGTELERAHVRAAGSSPESSAWSSPGRAARARARPALVTAGAAAGDPHTACSPPARTGACRPPAQCRRRVRPCLGSAASGRARGRRLYERRDGCSSRLGTPQSRRPPRRGGDVRTGRPLDSSRGPASKESRCSSR